MTTTLSSTSPSNTGGQPRRSESRVRTALRSPYLSLIVALVALIVIMTILRPDVFLTPRNLGNIAIASVLITLCALPQTVVILTAGIDISIGSIVGLSSVVCALVAAQTTSAGSAWMSVLVSVGIGGLCGLFNAAVITFGRVSPLIATLGTYTAFQGANFIVTGGQSTAVLNPALSNLDSGEILGITFPVWIAIIAIAGFAAFMKFTVFGRNTYAVGGNPVAARLAGINVNRYLLGIYTAGGLVGGLAGVLLTAKQGAGIPASGASDLALLSITAVALGGAALTGGKGTILGTVLGVAILGVLENGLLLLNVNALYQPVPRGLLLIIAVLLQQWRGQFNLGALLARPAKVNAQ